MFLQVRWVLLAHSSRRTLQGKGLQEHDEHMDLITSASHLDLLLTPQKPRERERQRLRSRLF